MTVKTVGLDLAKDVFQVHGISENGRVIFNRAIKRAKLRAFFETLPPFCVGLEACGPSHHWGRQLRKLGHGVKLMPAGYVKPYVKRGKNDAVDAEAICKAVRRPTMRFVVIKTEDQQAILSIHRTRDLAVRQRTQSANMIRQSTSNRFERLRSMKIPLANCIRNAALLFTLVLFGSAASPNETSGACHTRLEEDFEVGTIPGAFAAKQLQRGRLEVVADPVDVRNIVASANAGRKTDRVGKAALIHRFDRLVTETVVEMSARFRIDPYSPVDSIILMDLECASCGVDTNPGVRLYLRDGRLRIDRSKIGEETPFYSDVDHQVRPGIWAAITWAVAIGPDGIGWSTVDLDGQRVLDAEGATILGQGTAARNWGLDVVEGVDRFQIGITANSNRRDVSLMFDDVRFCAR